MKVRLVSLSVLCCMFFVVSVLAQNEALSAPVPSSQNDQYLIAVSNPPVLPDAPSAGLAPVVPALNAAITASAGQAPIPAAKVPHLGPKVIDAAFMGVTAATFGSDIADVELIMRCKAAAPPAVCTLIPETVSERRYLYPISFGITGGVTYLDYYLKAHHHRWWFAPAAAVMTLNTIYSVHAAHYAK